MNSQQMRSLCFLFLQDRFYINKSSPLTLKSYDSDFKQMFYKKSDLLLPFFKDKKKSAIPKEMVFKNLKAIQNSTQLKKSLETHIKQVLQNTSTYWMKLSYGKSKSQDLRRESLYKVAF